MRRLSLALFALVLAGSGLRLSPIHAAQDPAAPPPPPPPGPAASAAKDSRCFEMRTYYAAPGKADALNKRFRDHTSRLFQKHGMSIIGYWIPRATPDTIVYILAYKDRDAREASWKAFRSDPEWQAAAKASEADGRLVTKVDQVYCMDATDYSPLK